jgi:hypothetical protein
MRPHGNKKTQYLTIEHNVVIMNSFYCFLRSSGRISASKRGLFTLLSSVGNNLGEFGVWCY